MFSSMRSASGVFSGEVARLAVWVFASGRRGDELGARGGFVGLGSSRFEIWHACEF